MKAPKIDLSIGCLAFLCAYGVYDPYGSFWVFVLSVTLHEGAHILTLLCLKKRIIRIRGTLGGFVIQTEPLSYKQELLTAVAGPGCNLLLLCLGAGSFPVLALVNMILLGYNMLPFYPLDGGRILRTALRLTLPLPLSDMVERGVGLCTFCFLFGGSLYLSFGLHSGLWPVMFCGFLFFRVGEAIFPGRKNNSGKY